MKISYSICHYFQCLKSISESILNHVCLDLCQIVCQNLCQVLCLTCASKSWLYHWESLDKAYLRKTIIVPKLTQVEEYKPDPENEITISNSSLEVKTESHIGKEDLSLIVVRKGSIEHTKWPLYPHRNFLSFKHLSSSHKVFLFNHHCHLYHLI